MNRHRRHGISPFVALAGVGLASSPAWQLGSAVGDQVACRPASRSSAPPARV